MDVLFAWIMIDFVDDPFDTYDPCFADTVDDPVKGVAR